MIPVRNVYYMLSYAFSALRSTGYAGFASEDFENIDDLLAAILARGISQQAKRGLKREYLEVEQAVTAPRGKVDISASLKGDVLTRRELVCRVDEHSENTYFNRILKTAGNALLRSDASREHKRELRRALAFLSAVDPLLPRQVRWHHHFVRQDHTYRMLMALSRFALERQLHSPDAGGQRLEDFDEKFMHRLFERFVLQYFRREHGESVKASASEVPWAVDDGNDYLLPSMRTDVTLQPRNPRLNRVLIIDTKYYGDNMQHHHGRPSVRSGHLYQIFAYVKNEDAARARSGSPKQVSGMLLYAKTDEALQPRATYSMSGNKIAVEVLDLEADFHDIRAQLDRIVEDFLS